MIVAIVTFQMPKATTAEEMSAAFQAAVPMFQSVAGLLTKYFYVSEDGRRAGGIYVWASRADADRLYRMGGEWRAFVEKKFGSPPTIDFLDSPVMIDNRDRMNA
jgi:putative monooxygenase ydhR